MQRRLLMIGFAAAAILGATRAVHAQASTPRFRREQLDQMLAPIALYPDALQSQVLMAATYPLEVVEAARWSKAHPALKGAAAVDAVQGQDWDVSVKSLVAFPQVLAMMDEHLDWTQKLGDAVLAQQQDVANSIQRLRAQAAAAGHLAHADPLRVEYLGTGPDRTIVIEAADPNIVYVPYYDPVWAYGIWPYPAFPPYYWPPLAIYGYGPFLAVGFMFGVGIAASIALFGAWHWGPSVSYVTINVDRAVRIDPQFNRARINNGVWVHDPEHRRGVAYHDAATRERFGQGGAAVGGRQQFRGRVDGTSGAGQGAPAPQTRASQPGFLGPSRSYKPQPGGAINGVERGAQVNREAERGRAQVQRVAPGGSRGGHR